MKKTFIFFYLSLTIILLCSCNTDIGNNSKTIPLISDEETETITNPDTLEAAMEISEALIASATEAVTKESVISETTEDITLEASTIAQETTEAPEAAADYKDVLKAYKNDKNRTIKYAEICSKKTNAVIYITTEEDYIISEKNYSNTVIDVFNCDISYELSGLTAQVRVRGNSTSGFYPYSYKIKLEEKNNLLGLHGGKKYRSWLLLQPHQKLCPDYLAFKMAESFFGEEYYISDCEFVNVYMNGEYLGLYTLCEQSQVKKGRIEVSNPQAGNTSPLTGYLIEMENYIDSDSSIVTLKYGSRKFTDMLGKTRKIPYDSYTIKSNITDDSQVEFLQKYLSNVFEILWYAIEENIPKAFDENYDITDAPTLSCEEAVRQVIDVNSFIQMLLLEELTQNYDVGAGSFFMCIDFTSGAQFSKLTLCCPWDFNWGYDQPPEENYYASTWQKRLNSVDRSNIWFMLLMKAEWFRKDFYSFVESIASSGKLSEAVENVAYRIALLENDLDGDTDKLENGHAILEYVKKRLEFLSSESYSFFNG